MTDADVLARVHALHDALEREHGLCSCARRLGEALGEHERQCATCDGTGKVVVLDGRTEPWSVWLDLPRRSPVVSDIVRPVECPRCKGAGVRRGVTA